MTRSPGGPGLDEASDQARFKMLVEPGGDDDGVGEYAELPLLGVEGLDVSDQIVERDPELSDASTPQVDVWRMSTSSPRRRAPGSAIDRRLRRSIGAPGRPRLGGTRAPGRADWSDHCQLGMIRPPMSDAGRDRHPLDPCPCRHLPGSGRRAARRSGQCGRRVHLCPAEAVRAAPRPKRHASHSEPGSFHPRGVPVLQPRPAAAGAAATERPPGHRRVR